MKQALEALKSYLAAIRSGPVRDPGRVAALLSACWSDLAGDKRGVTARQVSAHTEKMVWHPPRLMFEIRRHGAASSSSTDGETQSWTVDTDAASAAESDALDEILRSMPAKRLIEAGIPPSVLKWWLHRVAEALSERVDHSQRKLERDKTKSLADRCLSLAKDIQDADEPPELIWPQNYAEWRALPKLLAHFARMWKLAHVRPPSKPIAAIPVFINFVKATTRREYYPEIAYLLYAINEIPQYRHRRAAPSARNLGQMMHRDRKKFNAYGAATKYSDILWLAAGIKPSRNQ